MSGCVRSFGLKAAGIGSRRMVIGIEHGKGGKIAMLSAQLLSILRSDWLY
ncbi:MAG: hypothetical protein WBW81_06855 [Methylocella sp.]